jgi:catechol 2,3-dioxygenase-like lactoylglutathione lyase family enzyme
MTPPAGFAWSLLAPELLVRSLAVSLRFWRDLIGFRIAYDRPEDGFAYLDLDGAQVMLEEVSRPGRHWITASLEPPFGRGINIQFAVPDLDAVLGRLAAAAWPLYMPSEEKWYRAGASESGVRQCLVQDPDGYLLRPQQPLGLRPAA